MIPHMLRLVWNRKRSTALVMVEIAASFIVLAAVLVAVTYTMSNWRKPLGFEADNVLITSVDRNANTRGDASAEDVDRAKAILAEVENIEGVMSAAYTSTPPYLMAEWTNVASRGGVEISYHIDQVTDGFAETMGVQLIEGRWFSPDDDALAFDPVVIDTDMARDFFGSESAVGQQFIPSDTRTPEAGETEKRVIGVVADYRKGGEASPTTRFMFERVSFGRGNVQQIPYFLAVKVAPGAAEQVEREISTRLRGVAPGWTFETQPMLSHRRSALRIVLVPIAIGVIVGGFLVLMVALGLIGVLGQSVMLRAGELGLRRAVGASRRAIRGQILGETVTITTLAVLVGLILVAQVPLIGIVSFVPASAWISGISLGLIVIFIVTLLAALYPSRIATQVDPAAVLRSE